MHTPQLVFPSSQDTDYLLSKINMLFVYVDADGNSKGKAHETTDEVFHHSFLPHQIPSRNATTIANVATI